MENTDRFERQLRGKGRRGVIALVVVGLAAVGAVVYLVMGDVVRTSDARDRNSAARERRDQKLREGAGTAEGKAGLARQVDEAVAQAHDLDAAFRTGVTAALARAELEAGGDTCAVRRDDAHHTEIEPGGVVPGSRLVGTATTFAEGAREDLAAGINPFTKRGDAFDPEGEDRYELVLGITRRVAPVRVAGGFVPGEVDGRAVLWDHARRAVVCVADIHATSSHEVLTKVLVYSNATANVVNGVAGREVDPSGHDDALANDLTKQVQNAIWQTPGMRAVEDGS